MAAVAYPEFRPQTPPRHLTLVPPPAPRRRSSIYWRRRLVVLVAVLLFVVAARAALGALGGGPLAAPETPAGRGGAAAVYVVQPGDTYWSIARHLQPTQDFIEHTPGRHGFIHESQLTRDDAIALQQ